MIHELKTWPDGFTAVFSGKKTHEVRPADRKFEVGDILYLREFVPHERCKGSGNVMVPDLHPSHYVQKRCDCEAPHGQYTGRQCYVEVQYITGPGTFGLPGDRVVMSIRRKD